MLKETFLQQFVFMELQLTEIDNLAFFAVGLQIYNGNRKIHSFSLLHWIHVPNLVFLATLLVLIFAST